LPSSPPPPPSLSANPLGVRLPFTSSFTWLVVASPLDAPPPPLVLTSHRTYPSGSWRGDRWTRCGAVIIGARTMIIAGLMAHTFPFGVPSPIRRGGGGGGVERCGSFPLCNSAPTPHAPIVEKGLLRGAWWSRAGACSNGLFFSFT
jgi:hypothetical protein